MVRNLFTFVYKMPNFPKLFLENLLYPEKLLLGITFKNFLQVNFIRD